MSDKMSDMVRGYLDGLSSLYSEIPPHLMRKPVAYRHGWLNGRDDRIGSPRDFAQVLKRRAEMITGGQDE